MIDKKIYYYNVPSRLSSYPSMKFEETSMGDLADVVKNTLMANRMVKTTWTTQSTTKHFIIVSALLIMIEIIFVFNLFRKITVLKICI